MSVAEKFVRITTTPQGTADVYLDDLHLKTFGGANAVGGAEAMKAQLVGILEAVVKEYSAPAPEAPAPVENPVEEEEKPKHRWTI